jgi:two-component system, LytTR family, sensor kinase
MDSAIDRGIERFFVDKARAFWVLQIGGWAAYALLRFLNGLANKMGLEIAGPTLIATLAGFSLTLIMAAVFRQIIHRGTLILWLVGIPTVVTAAAVFSAIEVWGHARFYDKGWVPAGLEFLGASLFDLYVLLSWSALYFGINYYLMYRQQQDRMMKLTAQAHQAQMKMLRYQLNPHFLFNTLNSISTLMMLKDATRANAMLGRLSAFLRSTLAAEPSELVPLGQDMETIRHYLDIEQLRFEDRMRVDIQVDPAAAQALVPSLLLQPLVENAVKYAVAPTESGAVIAIDASLQEGRLRIVLRDTGPGAPAGGIQETGVGLRNTRQRLAEVYGNDHQLLILSNYPSGVMINIDLPFWPVAAKKRKEVAA